jgi:hypothetical protein
MDARAYEIARIGGIVRDGAGDANHRDGGLNPARGFMLGVGVSAMLWAVLLAAFFLSVF